MEFPIPTTSRNSTAPKLKRAPQPVIGNPLIRGFGQLNSENYNTFFIPTFTPLHARSFIDRFKPIDFNYNSE